MTSELFSAIYNKALDILSRREHSVLELKQKLKKKYDIEDDIEETISRLKKNNLLNDLVDNIIYSQDVLIELNKLIMLMKKKQQKDYMFTTGVGNHQMMASQFIKWKDPGRFITSGSLGVMGVSTPYSIGCQLAHPEKLIVSIDGDGSFNHTLAELKTIKNYNLPIKIAIMNDGEMSMVKAWEHLFFEKRYAATKLAENPDYVSLANSFGIHGISCNSRDTLQEKIEEFLSFPGPILCDFRVQSDLCLPLVKPGNSLDDILKIQEEKNLSKIDVSACEVPN